MKVEDVLKFGNTPEDDLALVDGGFLSWVFGSSPDRIWMWNSQSWREFSAKRRKLIVMDSPHLLRQDFFPSYKGHRKEKADADPNWAEKVELVRGFRAQLRASNKVTTIELEGHEADDLITAFAMLYWREFDQEPLEVIAADKDLLQVGDFLRLNGYGATADKDISFEAWRLKQAVTLQPSLMHHSQILLVLALLGDKSDDVPRLVPARRLDMLVDVLQAQSPWERAMELFGEIVVKRNLYMTVLPGPWMFKDLPTVDQVMDRVINLDYFGHALLPEVVQLYRSNVRPLMF